MKLSSSPKFIVIDGLDGTGKSTQCKMLCAAIKANGSKAITTAEPSDSAIGNIIRVNAKLFVELNPKAEALLFAADRAVHVDAIQSALDMRYWVICDRYYYSSFAYQSLVANIDWIKELNKYFLKPDLAILLYNNSTDMHFKDEPDMSYEKRNKEHLRYMFLNMKMICPSDNIRVLHCVDTKENIHKKIVKIIEENFNEN